MKSLYRKKKKGKREKLLWKKYGLIALCKHECVAQKEKQKMDVLE